MYFLVCCGKNWWHVGSWNFQTNAYCHNFFNYQCWMGCTHHKPMSFAFVLIEINASVSAAKVGWQKSMELEARARLELMCNPYFIHWFFLEINFFFQLSWRLALHWLSAVSRPGIDLIFGFGNWSQQVMLTARGFNVSWGCSSIGLKLKSQKENQCRIYSSCFETSAC